MTIQPTLPGLLLPVPRPTTTPARPDLGELRDFPQISSTAKTVFAKRLGTAAEQLCDSILNRCGIDTIPMAEFSAYDRVIRIDTRELRLQIKTRLSAWSGRFEFRVAHGNPRHASGVRAYADDAFDLVALVVLHENVVKFSASKAQRQCVALSEVAGLRARPFASLDAALRNLEIEKDRDPDLPIAA